MDLLQTLEAIGVTGVVFGIGVASAGHRLERSPLGKGTVFFVMFVWIATLLSCILRLTGRFVPVVGPTDCASLGPHHVGAWSDRLVALASSGSMAMGTVMIVLARTVRSPRIVAAVVGTMTICLLAFAPTRGLDWPIVGQFDGAADISMNGRRLVQTRCTMESCSFVLDGSSEAAHSSPRAWTSEHGVVVRQRGNVLVFERLDRFSLFGSRAFTDSRTFRWDDETAFAIDAHGIRSVFADETAVRRPPGSLVGASLAACAFLALLWRRLNASWTVPGILLSIAAPFAFVAVQFLQRSTDALRCL